MTALPDVSFSRPNRPALCGSLLLRCQMEHHAEMHALTMNGRAAATMASREAICVVTRLPETSRRHLEHDVQDANDALRLIQQEDAEKGARAMCPVSATTHQHWN